MTLTPIDTIKTTQQTQGGGAGLRLIKERVRQQGVASLWYGALATAAATFVGHCKFYMRFVLQTAMVKLIMRGTDPWFGVSTQSNRSEPHFELIN